MSDANESGSDGAGIEDPKPPREQFQCKFHIKVLDNATKNGENVLFTICTKKLSDNKEFEVVRQFDDLQWLHHNLITQSPTDGIIVPPLGPRPIVEVKVTEKASKQQLGSTAVMKGDEYEQDGRKIEKYFRSMAQHEVFGSSLYLENFLTVVKAPTRAKVKKGLLGKMSSVVSEVRRGHHKDIAEYFVQQKQWFQDYHEGLKDASTIFGRIVAAEIRVASTYAQLSTALAASSTVQDGVDANANQLLMNFGEALDDASQSAAVSATNSDRTLGFTLDLYLRYMEPCKEMLFRRVCLLINFEEANRAFIKAKPEKKVMVERGKKEAEEKFESCSENARNQLKQFHQTRVLDYQAALSRYAEAQIKTARDAYALTLKTLNAIRATNVNIE